ncbi:MAG TPA: glycosyltransferase [Spirochaetota bacterium]|nr:glycosyltransferase [Spirochaetota bacterium]
MIKEVTVTPGTRLEEYADSVYLTGVVEKLKKILDKTASNLKKHTVWMVNSTAEGGGVAEMLPRMIFMLREAGITARWAVISTEQTAFFNLTKRMHNLFHGSGRPELSKADFDLYENVSTELVQDMKKLVQTDDIVVIHDPQPAGMGSRLKDITGVKTIFRCHIGLDKKTEQTTTIWNFMKPYLQNYDQAVFTAPEYIPSYLKDRSVIIHPALDPFTAKNRELRIPRLTSILYASGLAVKPQQLAVNTYQHQAERLQSDNTFKTATLPQDIGLLSHPFILQVSRWDNLKGWQELMEAFIKLKQNINAYAEDKPGEHKKRLQQLRLVMAGPETAAVKDDPEAQEVLQILSKKYCELHADLQKDIILLSLPMTSREENALMVSALHTCATAVVQNSIQEGFGLTATEPMWKGTPVIVSNACGLRQQVTAGREAAMIQSPGDSEDVAATINQTLSNPDQMEAMAQKARRRVRDEFLIFTQLDKYCQLLNRLVKK